jgi:hypothetical protein
MKSVLSAVQRASSECRAVSLNVGEIAGTSPAEKEAQG